MLRGYIHGYLHTHIIVLRRTSFWNTATLAGVRASFILQTSPLCWIYFSSFSITYREGGKVEQTLDVYDLTCSMGEKTSKEHVHYRRSPLWEVPSTFMGCRAEANICCCRQITGRKSLKQYARVLVTLQSLCRVGDSAGPSLDLTV